jgi:hypothetical protein
VKQKVGRGVVGAAVLGVPFIGREAVEGEGRRPAAVDF